MGAMSRAGLDVLHTSGGRVGAAALDNKGAGPFP